MKRQVRMAGKPFGLAGRELEPGEYAPNFTAVTQDMGVMKLSDFTDRIKLITFFPSLDTSVCSDQVKEFNRRAKEISSDVVCIGVSMDLPFAQKRFCEANAIKDMTVVSDYRLCSFGSTYGVLVEELRLLARGAVIVDKNNILRFSHCVDELTGPVDFDLVMGHLAEVAADSRGAAPAFPWRCIPCEQPSDSLEPAKLDMLLAQSSRWRRDRLGIAKEFIFRDFPTTMRFVDVLTAVSEEEGYSPSLSITGNRLTVGLDADGGLTENEFIMSRIIDEITY